MNHENSPDLSIIIPFLNEEAALPLLHKRMKGLKGLPDKHEIIFVSDGSTDGSIGLVERWANEDPRIKLVALTRNFGHQSAISAGMDLARGNFVGIMDADLQDSPELMIQMYETAVRENCDIVFSTREQRQGAWPKRLAYRMFYMLYACIAETPIDPNSGDFCVLSRKAVAMLVSMPERVRFLRGLRSWTGLKSLAIPTSRPERAAGQPQYTWSKLFYLASNGLISFSVRPLRIATLAGLLLCAASSIAAVVYLVLAIGYDIHSRAPGFTTLVILILFLYGVQLLIMGIIGEYIAQIFLEVKGRPTYLVNRLVNLPDRKGE